MERMPTSTSAASRRDLIRALQILTEELNTEDSKPDFITDPFGRNSQPIQDEFEYHGMPTDVGTIDLGVGLDSQPEAISDKKQEIVRSWAHLRLPILVEDATDETDGKYYHGQTTYDDQGSILIKVNSGRDEYGNLPKKDHGRSRKLIPVEGKNFFDDRSLNEQVLYHKATNTYYLPQPATDKVLTEMLPDGLNEGELVVIEITDFTVETINSSDRLTREKPPQYQAPTPDVFDSQQADVWAGTLTMDTDATQTIDDIVASQQTAEAVPAAPIPVGREAQGDAGTTPVDQPEVDNTEAGEDLLDEVAETQFQVAGSEDELEVDKPKRERSKDKPSSKIALGRLAVKRTLDRFNSLSKGRKAVAGIVGTALVAAGAWGSVSVYENVIESSGENKELSNEILADPLELEVSSMSGHLDLQIPTKDGFVKAPFIDTTIDRLEEKVESNVEITPDNLSQVLKSAYPDAAEPDYLAVNKSGVEVTLDSSNGKLIKDIDHKTGTVTVNLDKLELTVNTTVSSDKKNMKFAPSIVQEGGFGDISAEDMGAYVDTLQKDESNLRDSAAKFVEGEVSNSIVTANSGQDLEAVVKSQLSKRIERETGYSAIEFQGQYTVNIHEDDRVSVDKNSVLQGVSNLHLKDGEKGIKIVHDEDQSVEKENSK